MLSAQLKKMETHFNKLSVSIEPHNGSFKSSEKRIESELIHIYFMHGAIKLFEAHMVMTL